MRKTIRRGIIWLFVVAALGGVPAVFADGTTQPAQTDGQTQMRPGPAYVIQRYKNAIGQLTLSDDEKTKTDAFLEQARQQGLDLSGKLGDAAPGDRYRMLGTFARQLHGQLAQILTADQMTTVDQKMGPAFGQRGGGFAGAPTTRPGGARDQGNVAGAHGGPIEIMRQALAKMDLSDDQKQQIADLLKSVGQQIADLRQKAKTGENVQQEMYQVRQQMREKLETILTDDQMQTFLKALEQARQNRGGRLSPQADAGDSNASSDLKAGKPADLDFSGPEVGAAVPDVQIVEANGRAFSPAKYKGRVLVLEFGSMSCPVFREHAEAMEKLKASESSRAFFLIIYTREAFPAGDKNAERNKEEGVSVPDAASLDDRKAQALETQRELRITIPMAVDSMDNSISKAFGGFPNGAVVIGKDGTIAAHQEWTNPDTLRMAIDDAVSAPEVAVSR